MVGSVRAVFLDRDGVISRDIGVKIYPKRLHIFKRSFKAIRILNKNHKVIVVTNQPHVARGLCTEEDVIYLNNWLIDRMKEKKARIDAVYYCPHHPEQHHADIKPHAKKYRIVCECRKPGVGMLMAAQKKFRLNLSECYMIGDRTIDIIAGKRAGCRTILVKTGKAGKDSAFNVEPDHIFRDVYSAALFIDKNV